MMMMDCSNDSKSNSNNSTNNIHNKTSTTNNINIKNNSNSVNNEVNDEIVNVMADSHSDIDRTLIAAGGQNGASIVTNANDTVDAVDELIAQCRVFDFNIKKVESPNLAPSSSSTRTSICRFFLRGICRFDSMCLYSHEQPNMYEESYPSILDANTNGDIGGDLNVASGYRQSFDEDQDKPSTSNSSCNNSTVNICNNSKNHTNDSDSSTSNQNNASLKNSKTLTNEWVNAPVFIPKPLSQRNAGHVGISSSYHQYQPPFQEYDFQQQQQHNQSEALNYSWADVVGGVNGMTMPHNGELCNAARGIMELCPYDNPCPYGNYCGYNLHWELCEMCDQYCLHPKDENQRKVHKKECLQQHEQAMELSFAIARSKDKTCGICFETIMEKSGHEKRFGILSNCNHIFCLECIRKWRQAKQFENKITRSCPECRVSSDFVCPSAFWVETKEEKDKLLNDYRKALGIKDCKYFKKGVGKCPFGNKCFYRHALPNGELVDVGGPRKSRRVYRSNNDISNLLDIYLYEFLESRDINFLDFLATSTSDDSDNSDYNEE